MKKHLRKFALAFVVATTMISTKASAAIIYTYDSAAQTLTFTGSATYTGGSLPWNSGWGGWYQDVPDVGDIPANHFGTANLFVGAGSNNEFWDNGAPIGGGAINKPYLSVSGWNQISQFISGSGIPVNVSGASSVFLAGLVAGVDFVPHTASGPNITSSGTSSSAIPEPSGILALGCLLGAGIMLRTRRKMD